MTNPSNTQHPIQLGALHLVSAFVVAMGLASGCSREYTRESFTFDQTITRIELDVDSHATVEPSGTTSSSVDVDVSCLGGADGYNVSVVGETLKVRYGCDLDSDGTFKVRLPASVVSGSIHTDAGNLNVTGLQGQLNLSTDAGNLDASDLQGHLDLRADAGNVRVSNLNGQISLRVDSGNISGSVAATTCVASADSGSITLDLLEPPTLLDVGVDSGNIYVRVPTGAYTISTSVDSGSAKVQALINDPSAPKTIKAVADSGNISIVGY